MHVLSRDVSLCVQFYLVMKGQGKDLQGLWHDLSCDVSFCLLFYLVIKGQGKDQQGL